MENKKRVKINENVMGSQGSIQNDDSQFNNNQKQQGQLKVENIYEEFKLYELKQQQNNEFTKKQKHFMDIISFWRNNNNEKKNKLKSANQQFINVHNIVLDTLELEQKQRNYMQRIEELKLEQQKKQEDLLKEEHISNILDHKIKEYDDSKQMVQEQVLELKELVTIVDQKKEHIKEEITELMFKSSFIQKEVKISKSLLKEEDEFQKIKIMKYKEKREVNKKSLNKNISNIQKIRNGIHDKIENLQDLKEEIQFININREKMNQAKQDSLKFIQELDIIDQISKLFIKGDPKEVDLQAIFDINNNDQLINSNFQLELFDKSHYDSIDNSQVQATNDDGLGGGGGGQNQLLKFKKLNLKLNSDFDSQSNNKKNQLITNTPSNSNKSPKTPKIMNNFSNCLNNQNSIIMTQNESQQNLENQKIQIQEKHEIAKENQNKAFQQIKELFQIDEEQSEQGIKSLVYYFTKKSSSLLVSQSKEKITDNINKFLNENENDLSKLQQLIVEKLRSLQMQDVTLKNRISDMNSQVLKLKKQFVDLQVQEQESIQKDTEHQKIEDQYQDIQADQGIYLETLQELKEKIEVLEKNKVSNDKCFQSSEKFISQNFYFFNELIFRYSSIILAVQERSQIEMKSKLNKLALRLFDFTKKIRNIFNDDINKYNNEYLRSQRDFNSKSKENILEVSRQESFARTIDKYTKFEPNYTEENFFVYLRSDFVLFNFLKIEDLNLFLDKYCEDYKKKDEYYKRFKSLDSYLLERSLELKEYAIIGYEKSLQFLMENAHDLLADIKETNYNMFQKVDDLDKQQTVNHFSLSRIQLQKRRTLLEQMKSNQDIPVSTKKKYRVRVAMQKCREYDLHYGVENNKKIKTKAETIVDVIYEAIYDALRNIKSDGYDKDEEETYFHTSRIKTYDADKDLEIYARRKSVVSNSNNNKINSNISQSQHHFSYTSNLTNKPQRQAEDKQKMEFVQLDSQMPKKQSKKIQSMNQVLLAKLKETQVLYLSSRIDQKSTNSNFYGTTQNMKMRNSDEKDKLSDQDKINQVRQQEQARNVEKSMMKQKIKNQYNNEKKQFLQKKFFKQNTQDIIEKEMIEEEDQQIAETLQQVYRPRINQDEIKEQTDELIQSQKSDSINVPCYSKRLSPSKNTNGMDKFYQSQTPFDSSHDEQDNLIDEINYYNDQQQLQNIQNQYISTIVTNTDQNLQQQQQQQNNNKLNKFNSSVGFTTQFTSTDQQSIKESEKETVRGQAEQIYFSKSQSMSSANVSSKLEKNQKSIYSQKNEQVQQQLHISTESQLKTREKNIKIKQLMQTTSLKLVKIPESLKLKSLQDDLKQKNIKENNKFKQKRQIEDIFYEDFVNQKLKTQYCSTTTRYKSLVSLQDNVKLSFHQFNKNLMQESVENIYNASNSVRAQSNIRFKNIGEFSQMINEKINTLSFLDQRTKKYLKNQQKYNF